MITSQIFDRPGLIAAPEEQTAEINQAA